MIIDLGGDNTFVFHDFIFTVKSRFIIVILLLKLFPNYLEDIQHFRLL
jgi:hypothetical protein